jgi:hypothetical protein
MTAYRWLSASELRRRPDGLPLLTPECQLSWSTVARGGVQIEPKKIRVGRATGALQCAEELIARGAKLKRSVDGDLGVRHGPTYLPDIFLDSSEDLEGLTFLAKSDRVDGKW